MMQGKGQELIFERLARLVPTSRIRTRAGKKKHFVQFFRIVVRAEACL